MHQVPPHPSGIEHNSIKGAAQALPQRKFCTAAESCARPASIALPSPTLAPTLHGCAMLCKACLNCLPPATSKAWSLGQKHCGPMDFMGCSVQSNREHSASHYHPAMLGARMMHTPSDTRVHDRRQWAFLTVFCLYFLPACCLCFC